MRIPFGAQPFIHHHKDGECAQRYIDSLYHKHKKGHEYCSLHWNSLGTGRARSSNSVAARDFVFSTPVQTQNGPTQPYVKWLQVFLFWRQRVRSVTLATHNPLAPMIWKSRAILLLPRYGCMACYGETFTLTFTLQKTKHSETISDHTVWSQG